VEGLLRFVVPSRLRAVLWALVVASDWGWLKRLYLFVHPEVRGLRLTRRTQLLIDGYSRSGNTYAVCAFQEANGSEVRLAHHLHDARWFVEAADRGVPALLLVRRPLDVMASMVQFEPGMSPRLILEQYAAFYERLVPVRDRLVVADFDEVVRGGFGDVIRRVNDRFGTTFVPFESEPEVESSVLEAIDEFGRQHYAGSDFVQRVSRPSADRRPAAEIIAQLGAEELAAAERAEAAYHAIRQEPVVERSRRRPKLRVRSA
jgi:hypothetical protein